MVNKIISKTIMFVLIVAFVSGFQKVFGSANTLVGVTVVIGMLVLMSIDLTKKIWKNTALLIGVNLLLGIFAQMAAKNIWIGTVINFITLASIGYFLSYNLNKILIVPFGLQYLFMLYKPVVGEDFTKRLIALLVGALLIMLVQVIVHRKKNTLKVEKEQIINYEDQTDDYKIVNIFGKDIKVHTLRASYAIRVGLLTAVAAFITDYFNLENGRWIVFTIFSLTELYSENCKVRAKDRMVATLVGGCIVLILFVFVKDTTVRGLIILIAGYLNSYASTYRVQIITVTISVIASMALTDSTIQAAFERIFYVFIGVILALIANKCILNNSSDNSSKT